MATERQYQVMTVEGIISTFATAEDAARFCNDSWERYEITGVMRTESAATPVWLHLEHKDGVWLVLEDNKDGN